MDVSMMQLAPGDPGLIDKIVCQLKSNGIFDQFRKECIADVDTKPAYQNLRQRVEGSVSSFLSNQEWRPDLNKNQLRDSLRKHIHESGFLDIGVERIVDQVVNPKMYTVFFPKVEDVVYGFLGLEKPKRGTDNASSIHFGIPKLGDPKPEKKFVSLKDLLPTDLDPISPEKLDSDEGDMDEVLDQNELPRESKPAKGSESMRLKAMEDEGEGRRGGGGEGEEDEEEEEEGDEGDEDDDEEEEEEASPPFESLEIEAQQPCNAVSQMPMPPHSADMLDNITSSSSSSSTTEVKGAPLQFGMEAKAEGNYTSEAACETSLDQGGRSEAVRSEVAKSEVARNDVSRDEVARSESGGRSEGGRNGSSSKGSSLEGRKGSGGEGGGRRKEEDDRRKKKVEEGGGERRGGDKGREEEHKRRGDRRDSHRHRHHHHGSSGSGGGAASGSGSKRPEGGGSSRSGHGEGKDEWKKKEHQGHRSSSSSSLKDKGGSGGGGSSSSSKKPSTGGGEKVSSSSHHSSGGHGSHHHHGHRSGSSSGGSGGHRHGGDHRDGKAEEGGGKERTGGSSGSSSSKKKGSTTDDHRYEREKKGRDGHHRWDRERSREGRGGGGGGEGRGGSKQSSGGGATGGGGGGSASSCGTKGGEGGSGGSGGGATESVEEKVDGKQRAPPADESGEEKQRQRAPLAEEKGEGKQRAPLAEEKGEGKQRQRAPPAEEKGEGKQRQRALHAEKGEGKQRAPLAEESGEGKQQQRAPPAEEKGEGKQHTPPAEEKGEGASHEQPSATTAVTTVKHEKEEEVRAPSGSDAPVPPKVKKPKIAANVYEVKKIMEERKRLERKETERKEMERKEKERKETERKEMERKETERKEMERKETEREEVERKEVESRGEIKEMESRGEAISCQEGKEVAAMECLAKGPKEDSEEDVLFLEEQDVWTDAMEFVSYVQGLSREAEAGDFSRVPLVGGPEAALRLLNDNEASSSCSDFVELLDVEVSKEEEEVLRRMGAVVERRNAGEGNVVGDREEEGGNEAVVDPEPASSATTCLAGKEEEGGGSGKRPRRPNPRYNSGEYSTYSDEERESLAMDQGSDEGDEEPGAAGQQQDVPEAAVCCSSSLVENINPVVVLMDVGIGGEGQRRRRGPVVGRRLGVRGPLRRLATPDAFVMPLSPESDVSTASGDVGRKALLINKEGLADSELMAEEYESESGHLSRPLLTPSETEGYHHSATESDGPRAEGMPVGSVVGNPSCRMEDGDQRRHDESPISSGARRIRGTRSSSRVQQRYSSDDLYKPRPNITLGRRNRGKNSPSQEDVSSSESGALAEGDGERSSPNVVALATSGPADEGTTSTADSLPNKKRRR